MSNAIPTDLTISPMKVLAVTSSEKTIAPTLVPTNDPAGSTSGLSNSNAATSGATAYAPYIGSVLGLLIIVILGYYIWTRYQKSDNKSEFDEDDVRFAYEIKPEKSSKKQRQRKNKKFVDSDYYEYEPDAKFEFVSPAFPMQRDGGRRLPMKSAKITADLSRSMKNSDFDFYIGANPLPPRNISKENDGSGRNTGFSYDNPAYKRNLSPRQDVTSPIKAVSRINTTAPATSPRRRVDDSDDKSSRSAVSKQQQLSSRKQARPQVHTFESNVRDRPMSPNGGGRGSDKSQRNIRSPSRDASEDSRSHRDASAGSSSNRGALSPAAARALASQTK